MTHRVGAERMIRMDAGYGGRRIPFGRVHALAPGGTAACGFTGRLHDTATDWADGRAFDRCPECLVYVPIG